MHLAEGLDLPLFIGHQTCVPFPWPNYLPKVSLSKVTHWGLRFQHTLLRKHSSMWHSRLSLKTAQVLPHPCSCSLSDVLAHFCREAWTQTYKYKERKKKIWKIVTITQRNCPVTPTVTPPMVSPPGSIGPLGLLMSLSSTVWSTSSAFSSVYFTFVSVLCSV